MSTAEHLRAKNVTAALDALRHHGSMSRGDLERATGLSRTTVASIVEELDRRGLVSEQRDGPKPAHRGRGRPGSVIRLRRDAGLAVGIAVGHEAVHVALTDLGQTLVAERVERFALDTPAGRVMDVAAQLVDDALASCGGRGDVVGIGVGLPAPIGPEDEGAAAPVAGRWSAASVRDGFADRLGAPVVVENDANCEALAEVSRGAARGVGHAIYVKVSWGIGGAIVVDGRLRRGRTGAAGEFAHVQVREGGRPCGCGRPACLGPLASGHAVRDELRIVHGPGLELEDIVGLARSGDTAAARMLDDAGRLIGEVLAPVCNALNPHAVIVGGELGVPESPLVDAVRAGIARAALPAAVEALTVRPAALGVLSGALGAAGLVVRSAAAGRHLAAIR